MRKVAFFSSILFFGLMANVAFAQNPALMPFGGKITTAPTPGVTCPAGALGSPFTMVPSGIAPPGLYVGDYNPVSVRFRIVPSAWILGLYVPTPIPECATTSTPPAPLTGFRTFLHGTSVGI